MIQTAAIKKIFIQRGVDSILEYIGGKISTNYKQITNRTPTAHRHHTGEPSQPHHKGYGQDPFSRKLNIQRRSC